MDEGAGAMGGEGAEVRDEEAVRRFVEHTAMTWADWGFPRMAARVLMTLMAAEEDGLTAGELSERLAVSPAAISGAVRYLIQIGVLLREPITGSRSDLYRLPVDTWYQGSAVKRGYFRVMVDLAQGGVDALGGPGSRAGNRVAEMRDFFSFMEAEIESMLKRWEASRQP